MVCSRTSGTPGSSRRISVADGGAEAGRVGRGAQRNVRLLMPGTSACGA